MPIAIVKGDLADSRIIDLLNVHFTVMRTTAPIESCHVLAIDEMNTPDLSFWAAWDGDQLLGVGGLMKLTHDHGEIKSMHTAAKARGRGVGRAILRHIIEAAKARGMVQLSLETGGMDQFHAAHLLYTSHGFSICAPFGKYALDPNSVFMTRLV